MKFDKCYTVPNTKKKWYKTQDQEQNSREALTQL